MIIPVVRVRDRGTWMSVDDKYRKLLSVKDMPVSSFRVTLVEYKFVVETREDDFLDVRKKQSLLLTP